MYKDNTRGPGAGACDGVWAKRLLLAGSGLRLPLPNTKQQSHESSNSRLRSSAAAARGQRGRSAAARQGPGSCNPIGKSLQTAGPPAASRAARAAAQQHEEALRCGVAVLTSSVSGTKLRKGSRR